MKSLIEFQAGGRTKIPQSLGLNHSATGLLPGQPGTLSPDLAGSQAFRGRGIHASVLQVRERGRILGHGEGRPGGTSPLVPVLHQRVPRH